MRLSSISAELRLADMPKAAAAQMSRQSQTTLEEGDDTAIKIARGQTFAFNRTNPLKTY